MKQINKLLFLGLGLTALSVTFAQPSGLSHSNSSIANNGIPRIIPRYAYNLVIVNMCKELKIDITPMDQRKVLQEYIALKGNQNDFINDVKYYTSYEMSNMATITPEHKQRLCLAQKEVDLILERVSPEAIKKKKEEQARKARKNPLDD